MTTGSLFEPMRREDVDAVLAIERASYEAPWKREHFLAEIHTNAVAEPHVLREGAQIVGYLCAWWVVDELQILNVSVRPSQRRRGHARRMLREVIAQARARGCRVVRLEVRTSNTPARRLYESFGFVGEGRRADYYARSEDALLMRLDLGAGDGERP